MIEWVWGLAGGLVIGTAAALYLTLGGRIMGASGILGGLVDGTRRGAEPLAFVAGLICVPGILVLATGSAQTHLTTHWPTIIIAGLLVGVGTRMANGCTSGHGVCGISRLSPRGIVATIFYLIAGAVMVVAVRHIL